MRKRWVVLFILVGLVSCLCLSSGLVWLGGRLRHTPSNGPTVRIVEPHYGDRVPMERAVLVQSEARDAASLVTQVELWVDGQLQEVDGSQEPQGSPQLYAAQSWQPASPGSHTLMVRALNSRGAVGQAIIVVEAVEGLYSVGPEGQEVYLDDITSAEYVVSAGDTLEQIAQAHQVSPEEILDLNPELVANEPLPEGGIVEVPFDPETLSGGGEPGEEPSVGPELGPLAEPPEGPEPPEPPVVVPEPP
ncbi:MAG: Ig-like domain-containing protein, partial [Anaerolineae bacterium]|nr:Ig-like domain-containing protein [Anaerolineae bacterium]